VTGLEIPNTKPDPALAAYATTTRAQDAGSPSNWALLPVLDSGTSATQRYLVGPTLITLSSKFASATVTRVPSSGGWIVNVQLNKAESQRWNQVAKRYFHRLLAIDLNGVIVEAPLIEPDYSTFRSMDGQMQLVAVSRTDASDLAAALISGPLAVPLAAH
jgi:preprotein translocase subunit SecD